MIRKTITIDETDGEWLRENHINLSSFVRDKIKEERQK